MFAAFMIWSTRWGNSALACAVCRALDSTSVRALASAARRALSAAVDDDEPPSAEAVVTSGSLGRVTSSLS